MVRLSQTQNFPELNADLQQHIEQIQALISEVSHVERAPPTGWRVDVFPRANGITRGVPHLLGANALLLLSPRFGS